MQKKIGRVALLTLYWKQQDTRIHVSSFDLLMMAETKDSECYLKGVAGGI